MKDNNKLLKELTILKELKVAAACFQETNQNWRQKGVYDKIKKTFNKVWSKKNGDIKFSGED
eukprot:7325985-Ditylum_brightwellii.AAC.1